MTTTETRPRRTSRPRHAAMATARCGSYLDLCRCRHSGPQALTEAGVRARHAASVARAERSGWDSPEARMRALEGTR